MVIEGSVSTVSGNGSVATMSVDITKGLKKVAEHLNTNEKNGYHERVSRGEYRGGGEYSYMTPYSQSNTGYFCTPEKGDGVGVYYPSNKEGMAYVMGAINSPGSARFSNPNVRNYTLPENYDLRLNTDTITEYAKANISKSTDNLLSLTSGDVTKINSNSLFDIKVSEKIKVKATNYQKEFDEVQEVVSGEKKESIGTHTVECLNESQLSTKAQLTKATGLIMNSASTIIKKV